VRHLSVFISMVLLAGVFSFAQADTFYRWVDEEGVTHYSKTAPKGHQSETVSTTTGTSTPSSSSMAEDPFATSEEETTESSANEVKDKWCAQHRKNLEVLKTKDRVQQQDPETGEARILTEAERAEMIQQLEAQLEGC